MRTATEAGGGGRRRGLAPIVLAALVGLSAGDLLRPPESQAGTRFAVAAISAYQRTLSPLLARTSFVRCRFTPTCSEYGRGAIERFGWAKGGAMTIGRIARCNPFSRGGDDPVPGR
jgi:putative membrane protein insertion efficiency factor